ncbi:MAG: Ribonuclease HII [Candidatus Methanolliviera sp. GoM_asphalt]|nr:MAG: Ribonuclease HII [Candidatus Methanolliviera sp. GoM_asphalt]
MRYLGVDEAGKGPVIGSMFVAGVLSSEKDLYRIGHLLAKKDEFAQKSEIYKYIDSKRLNQKRRELLYGYIKKLAETRVLEVTAKDIDEKRTIMTMNDIMVNSHASLIKKFSSEEGDEANVIYLDASDVNEERFGSNVKKLLLPQKSSISDYKDVKIISEHKADEKYPLVAAASIVAKIERERSINELKSMYGDFGSGYPSDHKTIKFLQHYYGENEEFPEFVRNSWKTCERIKNKPSA